MAVFYTDTTNKYDTSTTGIEAAANSSGVLDLAMFAIAPIEGVINNGINALGSWISQFQKNSQKKQAGEQTYLLEADKQGYAAEGKVNSTVLVIVIVVIVAFLIIKKK